MSKNYLTEAFKELDLLESQSFDVDKKGTSELEDFLEDDSLDDFEVVIDPEAKTEEDLQKSYMGKVILMCDVCRSMIYKDPADIVIDEESQLANVGELCPYCFTGDGYKIIGKVAPYEEVTVEAEKPVEVKVDGEEVEDKIEEEIQPDQKFPVNHKKSPVLESFEDWEVGDEVEVTSDTLTPKMDSEMFKLFQEFDGAVYLDTFSDVVRDDLGIEVSLDEDYTDFYINWAKKHNLNADDTWIYEKEEDIQKYLDNLGYDEDEEDLDEAIQPDQKFPVEHEKAPVMECKKRLKKLKPLKESTLKESMDDILTLDDFLHFYDSELLHKKDEDKIKSHIDRIFAREGCPEDLYADECYKMISDKAKANISKIVKEYRKSNLKESMDDISITTEDQVIKIKSTPREDKETIQPVTETEVEKAKEVEEDIPVEEVETQEEEIVEEPEEVDVDLDEIDEEGMDDLGESYLKSVYENVNSFKTSKAVLQGNKMILEGVISFTSGNKAKTKFIFESKEATKRGKLKFLGENKNISKNKKAFTLIGSLNNKKLMLESLNYNYTGKDSKTGKTKRLYGTIRRKLK